MNFPVTVDSKSFINKEKDRVANDRVSDSESREKGKGFDLKDGKYTGSANGYGGKATVTVTIKNKKIVKIHIDSAPGETTSFFNRAKTLTDLMIRQQSTDVDAVSGATYSSKGIIGAVKNALYGIKSTTKQAPASFGEKGKAKKVAKAAKRARWYARHHWNCHLKKKETMRCPANVLHVENVQNGVREEMQNDRFRENT